MKCKKIITLIIATMLILLPMMTTSVQATVGKVYNLEAKQGEKEVYFTWSSASGADGYNLYINTSNKGYKYIGSVRSTKATVIGFKPSETYKVKIAAYEQKNNQKVEGSSSNEVTVEYLSVIEETSIAKVKNLNASQSGEVINLTWTEVSGATGYQIDIGIPGFGYMNIGKCYSNNVFVRGGKVNQTYEFRVRAYKETNQTTAYGDYSDSKTITLKGDTQDEQPSEVTLNKVTNVYVKNITSNSAYVSWGEVKNATGYEVWMAKENGKYSRIITTNKTYTEISSLNENTTYKVIIVAFNDEGKSKVYAPDSDAISFKTGKTSQDIKVKKVENVVIKNIYEDGAYITWNKAENATGYEVWLAKGSQKYTYIDNTTKTNMSISELESNTNYKVVVVAYNDSGKNKVYAPDSSVVSFTTKQDETVAQVKNLTTKVSDNTVTLSWTRIPQVTGYDIYLAEGNNKFKYKKTVKINSATLENLEYDTTYKVKVCAYKEINGKEIEGPYSTIKTFTTPKENIKNIQGFYVEVKHRNEAYLQWWANDNVDGYEVWLSENGGSFKKESKDSEESNYILYDLEYNTNYKVKVRAFVYKNGKKVYGDFSSIKSFKTEKYNKQEDSPNVGKVKNVSYYVVKDSVFLSWDKVSNADGYEIEFTVPGLGGATKITTKTNSREISGLTEKEYKYTARIRAYRIINGTYQYGQYSEIQKFSAK